MRCEINSLLWRAITKKTTHYSVDPVKVPKCMICKKKIMFKCNIFTYKYEHQYVMWKVFQPTTKYWVIHVLQIQKGIYFRERINLVFWVKFTNASQIKYICCTLNFANLCQSLQKYANVCKSIQQYEIAIFGKNY